LQEVEVEADVMAVMKGAEAAVLVVLYQVLHRSTEVMQ
jgi:hypothetical protein